MLIEIPMYLAHINTGALQRFIDLSILRKARRRNQWLVRFSEDGDSSRGLGDAKAAYPRASAARCGDH